MVRLSLGGIRDASAQLLVELVHLNLVKLLYGFQPSERLKSGAGCNYGSYPSSLSSWYEMSWYVSCLYLPKVLPEHREGIKQVIALCPLLHPVQAGPVTIIL